MAVEATEYKERAAELSAEEECAENTADVAFINRF